MRSSAHHRVAHRHPGSASNVTTRSACSRPFRSSVFIPLAHVLGLFTGNVERVEGPYQAQRTQFPNTAIVEIERDGVPQEYTTYFLDFGDFFVASFLVLTEPLGANVTEHLTLRITFTEDHFNGWDIHPEGTVDERNRTVVSVPRAQFGFDA